MIWVRSTVYWFGIVIVTPFTLLTGLLALFARPRIRHRCVCWWTPLALWWLRVTCNLSFRVLGERNIPNEPSIVACKHQSGWETMALQIVFPQQVWVLRRSLLFLPFWGWALALTSPIIVDRGNVVRSAKTLIREGRKRLDVGFWVVIFPEGTRVKPGIVGNYQAGAATLSRMSGRLVVPVAHNAGEFWARNAYLKYPGEITMVVCKPIEPDCKSNDELTSEIRESIEAEQLRIQGVGPLFGCSRKAN